MTTPNRYAPRAQAVAAPSRNAPGPRTVTPVRRRPATPPPSGNRKPLFLAGAAIASLAIGATVLNFITKPDPDAPTAGCVIAVDAQGSASTMRDAYRQWLPSQAEECAAANRANLSIALVSGETRTSTVTPVTSNLADLDYTGDGTNDKTIAANEIDRVVKEADEAILAAPKQEGGTDIVGALCVAHDLLRGHSPSTLIIFSDGIHYREPYLLTKVPLDDASVTQYVDALKADGQLCDLTGTQVQMYGVGIGSGTRKMSDEQLAGVRRFWETVIRATGADLVTYQRNP